MLVRHPNFKLSILFLATVMATSVSANQITVNAYDTYTDDIVATDNQTSLTVKQNGLIDNQEIVIKGGTLKFETGSVVKTGTLDVLLAPSSISNGIFDGRIETNTFIFRGTDGAGDNQFGSPLRGTIKAKKFEIRNDASGQTGLKVTNSQALAEVDEIYILATIAAKTGLQTEGDVSINSKVTLDHQATGQDVRLESVSGLATYSDVTAKGNKVLLQTNNGASMSINNLKVEDQTIVNLQTNGTSAEASHYTLNNVTVGKGANLRLCVYDNNPGAVIDGKNVNITMDSGAKVDFGGWKEEGNTDWKPQNIKIAADNLTFNVLDADSGNTIYLTGTEGNITTKKENIRVVGASQNNTGNAVADLEKLSSLVKYNEKDSTGNVSTQADGFTVEQQADDIHDGASGTVVKDGKVNNIQVKANSNINGIAEMTALGLHIWRNEINDMNKRLGELRDSSDEANGVWARVYNGKAKFGNQKITNKYTAFQFGYDRQVVPGTWLGGALSWTDGNNDFAVGGGDSSLLAFTGYGSKLWDNGMFLDVTGKFGRMKNEFDISLASGKSSASYHTNAVSVSAEAGWRLYPMQNSFYVEPQVELMYGHVFSVDYATSTGVNVEQDAADTLIGRAGVVLGLKCPDNRGNAYLRASVLHDWKGDADFTFSKTAGTARTISEELGGTWFEYGIGANFNATKQVHLYADVEAANGGEVDTDYRVNFGMRYSW